MSAIVSVYTDAVYDNLNPLHANWEPGREAKLGDYGLMRGHAFSCLGNIADLGIAFAVRNDGQKDQKFFASKNSVDIAFHAKGSVPVSGTVNAKASVEVTFHDEDTVFFNAAQCEYMMIRDKVALGKAIMDRYHQGQWQREWAVITDLVRAGATTIAVSSGSSGSFVLEATGDVPQIDLADASVGLTLRSSSNVGYRIIADKGITPLIGLCKIQSTFLWWNDDFRPLSLMLGNSELLTALQDDPRVQTEESESAVHFGQLR